MGHAQIRCYSRFHTFSCRHTSSDFKISCYWETPFLVLLNFFVIYNCLYKPGIEKLEYLRDHANHKAIGVVLYWFGALLFFGLTKYFFFRWNLYLKLNLILELQDKPTMKHNLCWLQSLCLSLTLFLISDKLSFQMKLTSWCVVLCRGDRWVDYHLQQYYTIICNNITSTTSWCVVCVSCKRYRMYWTSSLCLKV